MEGCSIPICGKPALPHNYEDGDTGENACHIHGKPYAA